ncbi:MAG: hypothetical protein JSS14_14125 [Proteobacteria bacterium]|nr:hypothetical protein [Pseudomonadota bacterium]
MNALKAARQQIENDPHSDSSRALTRLVLALQNEGSFELSALYELDYDTFNLTLRILDEWRVDRYYAKKLKLFDISLQAKQLGAH